MADHSSEPANSKLPPELERQIFEIAAHARPVAVLDLILVAWRVKAWVEPLLYRVIFVDGSGSTPIDGLPAFTVDVLQRLFERKAGKIRSEHYNTRFLGTTQDISDETLCMYDWLARPIDFAADAPVLMYLCSLVDEYFFNIACNYFSTKLTTAQI
ncbi:hypothetical protein C8R44DRAFT_875759 [Mycena epipterygia]|nr:hypothetical protein C8R44DRAFT_875759 [Mycena epipterygia]